MKKFVLLENWGNKIYFLLISRAKYFPILGNYTQRNAFWYLKNIFCCGLFTILKNLGIHANAIINLKNYTKLITLYSVFSILKKNIIVLGNYHAKNRGNRCITDEIETKKSQN